MISFSNYVESSSDIYTHFKFNFTIYKLFHFCSYVKQIEN